MEVDEKNSIVVREYILACFSCTLVSITSYIHDNHILYWVNQKTKYTIIAKKLSQINVFKTYES